MYPTVLLSQTFDVRDFEGFLLPSPLHHSGFLYPPAMPTQHASPHFNKFPLPSSLKLNLKESLDALTAVKSIFNSITLVKSGSAAFDFPIAKKAVALL